MDGLQTWTLSYAGATPVLGSPGGGFSPTPEQFEQFLDVVYAATRGGGGGADADGGVLVGRMNDRAEFVQADLVDGALRG